MKLINLTPHELHFRTEAGEVVLPPSGKIARCTISVQVCGFVEYDGLQIPIVKNVFGATTGIPDPEPDTLYVTSSLAAERSGRRDVISPDTGDTAVRDEKGRIVAVTRFQKFF